MYHGTADGVVLIGARFLCHSEAVCEGVECFLIFFVVEELFGFGEQTPLQLLKMVSLDVGSDLSMVLRHILQQGLRYRSDAERVLAEPIIHIVIRHGPSFLETRTVAGDYRSLAACLLNNRGVQMCFNCCSMAI